MFINKFLIVLFLLFTQVSLNFFGACVEPIPTYLAHRYVDLQLESFKLELII